MTSIFKQERPCLTIFRIAFLLELTILQDLPRHEDRSRSVFDRHTPWLLTEYTALRHCVVTSGKSWLVNRHRCRQIVTRKVSVLWHRVAEQELVSLVTKNMIAIRATPELGWYSRAASWWLKVCGNENLFRTTEISTFKSLVYILVYLVSSQTIRNLSQLDFNKAVSFQA